MDTPIGDYAYLADLHSGALVSREGSIDWLCLPRFDSDAVFAALLGTPEHGRWSLTVPGGVVVERFYEQGTFILHTLWRGPDGEAEVVEFMPSGDGRADLVRQVRCTRGRVAFEVDLRFRPEYGAALPWVRHVRRPTGEMCLTATAGPDAYVLHGPHLAAEGMSHRTHLALDAGQTERWVLTWAPSYRPMPEPVDVDRALAETRRQWEDWGEQIEVEGPWSDAVHRSLLVLKGLTHVETGGIVAAPTTSLPEDPGGERNWDYRYCWLRDSSLTLEAFLVHGSTEAALHWRDWLLRAVAGDPEDLQIMYGIAGERSLPERSLAHLPGYLGSTPVRVGNGAVTQFQADVVGEVLIALAALRDAGVAEDSFSWPLQRALLGYITEHADQQDQGLWEMRGEPHYYTHSRVMMWAGLDRGIRAVVEHGLDGDVAAWTRLRDRLGEEILDHGVEPATGAFRQTYDTTEVDASLLQIPQTGFVPYDDPHMLATVERIEQDLMADGLLLRYRTGGGADSAGGGAGGGAGVDGADRVGDGAGVDGLSGTEHPFLACSFWLVEQYARTGRTDEATELMGRLVSMTSDLGLLAEEYDPAGGRQIGNFPQAFSHLTLVRAADALSGSLPGVGR